MDNLMLLERSKQASKRAIEQVFVWIEKVF